MVDHKLNRAPPPPTPHPQYHHHATCYPPFSVLFFYSKHPTQKKERKVESEWLAEGGVGAAVAVCQAGLNRNSHPSG